MSRDEALAQAREHFDSGAFLHDLARRVAVRTESQDSASGPALQAYLTDEIEVFHHRRRCKERPDEGAPLRKERPLAEAHSVVLQRVPEDLQDVALGAFNAAIDLGAFEALGLAGHCVQGVLDGGFEGGVLAGGDANVGNFKDHEGLRF